MERLINHTVYVMQLLPVRVHTLKVNVGKKKTCLASLKLFGSCDDKQLIQSVRIWHLHEKTEEQELKMGDSPNWRQCGLYARTW